MRFGTWREAPLVLALAALLGLSLSATSRAGGWDFHPTLPKTVPAYDFNTGGEYFAPPVPYGHYAKDPVGHMAKGVGHIKGSLMGLGSHLNGLHGLGHGAGCGPNCGHLGHGGLGHGALGHGGGLSHGHGLGLGGKGCGFCSGLGLFKKHRGADPCAGSPCIECAPGAGRVKNFGPYHPTTVVASAQALPSGQALPSAQTVVTPTNQVVCVDPGNCARVGCGHGGLLGKLRCKLCGGGGCGPCGGMGIGDPCSSCHGKGCGLCGGCGLLSKLASKFHGCGFCGGAGCGNCLKGLASKLHGLPGMLHRPKYKWFMGAGGPVPLTPGYVPYIVTTRSPRDFFAFPPKNPDAF